MIRLRRSPLRNVEDALAGLQTAIQIELGTLPPYLYALYTIRPGKNAAANARIKAIALQEMIHLCLDCNILNALGGSPRLASRAVVPSYPGHLPGDLGGLTLHLLPFSLAAMEQGMAIETPEDGAIDFPQRAALSAAAPDEEWQTIGEFYAQLDACLAALPAETWHPQRNQITDAQFFVGNLFPVGSYADAHRAIRAIVSEGEGSAKSPLDFQGELAHYYRFEEVVKNRVLTRADNPEGYVWGESLDVDWSEAFPAIPDPGCHDFSDDPAARAAQDGCNQAFTTMLIELERAVQGEPGRLGNAVRAMFDLRMATLHALSVPLRSAPGQVAGPAFLFLEGSAS